MSYKQLTLTTILLFLSMLCFGQNRAFYKKFDSLIHAQNPRPFNGVILLTKNGKVKYSKVKGFQNFETKKPLSFDDQFEIMSNTKQITAVLVLKEVEKGNINLESPIKNYLPELTQSWSDSVIIHQLLNHTHGIIDIEKPLVFKPGTDFKYGNLSNIILGKILEKVTKKSYSDLASNLFKQFKMDNTFCFSKDDRKNLAYGHINKENKFSVLYKSFINEENMAADGVITTARDLAIWNENLHQNKILKNEMYQLMVSNTVLSQHDLFGQEKLPYGYGLRIVNDGGVKYYGHTGLGDGFASLNIYLPEHKLSLLILENQMAEDPKLYYYFETIFKDFLIKELKSKYSAH